jgi:hypothetical protein
MEAQAERGITVLCKVDPEPSDAAAARKLGSDESLRLYQLAPQWLSAARCQGRPCS